MTTIQGKFYRVSYNGEGVYEALRKKIGWDWKTVKQDPDINWLPQPQVDEYKDTYRSYFTTLGYKTFQAKTMKVINKYLDPEKLEVKEYNNIQGILMYKDQYQVVIDQEGVIMNEEAERGVNWFISEDDLYLNWKKWEDGSAHIVFVDGLSGSGKSTLGKKIAEQYDAYYVQLDIYGWGMVGQKAVDRGYTQNYDYVKENDRKLYEYMIAKRIKPDIFAKIDKWNATPEEIEFKVQEIEKYLQWLAFEQNERVVVEGGYTGVVMARNPEMWENTPIIFKGTSVSKSIFRRICRSVKKDGPIGVYTVLRALKPQYYDHMIPESNASRKAMLSGRDDWEYVKEDNEVEYMYPIGVNEEVSIDEDNVAHKTDYMSPLKIDEELLINPDKDLLAYREERRPILEEMQRKFHLTDGEVEEMRRTEEALHLWARNSKGYDPNKRRR